jgi:hypothetical protein
MSKFYVMKRFFIQIYFLLLIPCLLIAQVEKPFPILADKPEWNELVVSSYVASPVISINNYTYKYSVDTLICGKHYAAVTQQGKPMKAFVRNEGHSTFLRVEANCQIPDYKMYDFGDDLKTLGDLILIPLDGNSKGELAMLTNIDSISFNGKKRMRYELTFEGKTLLKKVEWIEGIGSPVHPFYPLIKLNAFDIPSYTLLCASENGVLKYQDTKYKTCFYKEEKPFWEFKDGVTWNFVHYNSVFPAVKDTWKYDSEVSLCGQKYSRIIFPMFGKDTLLLRNQGNKTFYRSGKNCAKPEYMLYDFDLKLGDTFNLANRYHDKVKSKVTKVDTVFRYDKNRKRIVFEYSFPQDKGKMTEMTWVEGLGSELNPFYIHHIYPQLADPDQEWVPLCYFQGTTMMYKNNNFVNCAISATNDNQDLEKEITVSPNPFDNSLTVNVLENNKNLKLNVFDLAGKMLSQSTMSSETATLELDFLAKGVYFLKIEEIESRKSRTIKIVK